MFKVENPVGQNRFTGEFIVFIKLKYINPPMNTLSKAMNFFLSYLSLFLLLFLYNIIILISI